MTAGVDLGVPGRLPATYTVDGLTFGARDTRGNLWIPQKTDGWHNTAAPRGERTNRVGNHGTFRAVAWREERTFTIEGLVYCANMFDRIAAEETFAALCSDPGRLYQFVATDQAGNTRTASVELASRPKFALANERRADYQIEFAAPDPRKHDFSWQQPISTLPTDSMGGLDFAGSGLDFSGSGLDWGAGAAGAPARVGNYGSAPAYPVFTIAGPLEQPVITAVGSGASIYYGGTITSNETVTVNCDGFPQLGLPGHACVSSTRGNVRSLLTIGDEWPRLEPGAFEGFQLQGSGGASPTLQVSVRSAWW